MFKKHILLCLALVSMGVFSCKKDAPSSPSSVYQTHLAEEYDGQMAHDWVDLGNKMVRETGLFGPNAARAMGYIGLTLHESVVHGIAGGRSLAGQINGLTDLPQPKTDQIYDWGIVLCAAMKMVMPQIFDQLDAAQRSSVETLAAVQESEMMHGSGMTAQIANASRSFGIEIGNAILKRVQNDGRDIIRNIVPQLPARSAAHPEYWDATTLGQTPIEPLWSTVQTFVVASSQACEAAPPHPFSTEPTSDFFNEAKEIYQKYPLSQADRAVVYNWEDGPTRSASATGHWMNIAAQILKNKKWDLARSAQAYALVGLTAADAFSVAFFHQYKYDLLRPVTYVRENLDAAWSPAIFTPASPDFLSSEAVLGGAEPVVLKKLFGDIGFVDETHKGSPLFTPDGGPYILPERTFSSFTKAGEEAAESRVLAGVSFRRSVDLGLETGRCVGQTVLQNVHFTK